MLSGARTFVRCSSAASLHSAMTDLVSRMNTVWENGIATKNLVVLNTSTVYIAEKGCNVAVYSPLAQSVVHCSHAEGRRVEEEGIQYKCKDKGDCRSVLHRESQSHVGGEGDCNAYSHVEQIPCFEEPCMPFCWVIIVVCAGDE